MTAPLVEAGPLEASLLELEVGPVAHGGHCVARHEGRVVFVRHALPGERVRARLTEAPAGASFWRADAVEVLVASPERVEPPCPWAGPGRCGGCDWQHATLPAQRELKAAVVREQLARLAGLEVPVAVEPVPGDEAGLGWRTRVTWAVDRESGRAGLRRHRSHAVVPVDRCRIASDGVDALGVTARSWRGAEAVLAVASGLGDRAVVMMPAGGGEPERVEGRSRVRERAAGREWRVSATGFWQVHPGAADALVAAVLEGVRPAAGMRVLDLYAGSGLFAGALGEAVGGAGSVVAVEGDAAACADARRNLHDLPQVRIVEGRVDRVLGRLERLGLDVGGVDAVVLDPPRTGARAPVVRAVAALRPALVAYVACDPAALARDVRTFRELGYELAGLRAYDLFPMTHHVECVATLRPTA